MMTIHSIDPRPFNGKTTSKLLWCMSKDEGKQYNASIRGHSITGSESEVASKWIYEGWKGEIVRPKKEIFVACNGKNVFLKCNKGVQEGSLYFLSSGILFLKPALFLPAETISTITAGRAGCSTTRYIDLNIATDSGENFEFSNIEREELLSIQQYVGYHTKFHRRAKNEPKKTDDESMGSGSKRKEDESSDESDEDYNPDSNDSEAENESESSGDESSESTDGSSKASSDVDDEYASEEELVLDEDIRELPAKRIKSSGADDHTTFCPDISKLSPSTDAL